LAKNLSSHHNDFTCWLISSSMFFLLSVFCCATVVFWRGICAERMRQSEVTRCRTEQKFAVVPSRTGMALAFPPPFFSVQSYGQETHRCRYIAVVSVISNAAKSSLFVFRGSE
jgi:hypothetical protein